MHVTPFLEDVVVIAAVIAAGCEPCAESAVERAVGRGAPDDLIAQTLRVVAGIRAQECFGRAVGPEVVARMERPLEAGRRALRRHASAPGAAGCCGSPATVR